MNAPFDAPSLLTDAQLRPYLDDVRQWHGYVRFLGLPTMIDNPDTPIHELFVMPGLSDSSVTPESDPHGWPSARSVLSMLAQHRRLIVLGDPGSGKSTIVNWLAWTLAGGQQTDLPSSLVGVLPLPMVARELKLEKLRCFDNLIDAFLGHAVARHLPRERAIESLAKGRALLLIDGLDEVSAGLRETLRDVLREGAVAYPASFMLATSRLIGYESAPLEAQPRPVVDLAAFKGLESTLAAGSAPQAKQVLRDATAFESVLPTPPGSQWTRQHVMPFDDSRIANFAQRWYALRSFHDRASRDAGQFVEAIHADPSIHALARLPQLLTLMALIHRIGARLPDGRAILYAEISQAYLRSIDSARGLAVAPNESPWQEKQRWLARVGFEMQCLRAQAGGASVTGDARELLVSRQQVLTWIRSAMAASGYSQEAERADEYLDWVARRSGLLLPRGDGLFAFVHLSFQEYFAALYVAEHVADADWVMAQRLGEPQPDHTDARIDLDALRAWAGTRLWQEVFVFVFESLAPRQRRDIGRLVRWLFPEDEAGLTQAVAEMVLDDKEGVLDADRLDPLHNRLCLLARLVFNPHSGLDGTERQQGWLLTTACLRKIEGLFDGRPPTKRTKTAKHGRHIEQMLLARILQREEGVQALSAFLLAAAPLELIATAPAFLSTLSQFPALPSIERLTVWFDEGEIPRLATRLPNLKHLYFIAPDSRVDANSLVGLTGLTHLFLLSRFVESPGALSTLSSLEDLYLFAPVKPEDLSVIDGLERLKSLALLNDLPLPPRLSQREQAGQLKVHRPAPKREESDSDSDAPPLKRQRQSRPRRPRTPAGSARASGGTAPRRRG